MHGLVQNKRTLELLPGTLVSLFDKNNELINKTTIGEDASYLFEVENNKTYKLVGTRKLYVPAEIEFSTSSKGDIDKNIQMLMEMYTDVEKEIVVENDKVQIKINPIYFNYDKWNIRKDAAIELNNVVNIMKKYPDMTIEIGAHTDARGTNKYNLKLSKKRAKSVMNYLMSQGISENRLKSEGFGESQPLNHCTHPKMCTRAQYSINRRCEFVITN